MIFLLLLIFLCVKMALRRKSNAFIAFYKINSILECYSAIWECVRIVEIYFTVSQTVTERNLPESIMTCKRIFCLKAYRIKALSHKINCYKYKVKIKPSL